MMWILYIYLGIGLLWTTFILITNRHLLRNWFEFSVAIFANLFLWPLVMILAFAAGKFFKGLGGN